MWDWVRPSATAWNHDDNADFTTALSIFLCYAYDWLSTGFGKLGETNWKGSTAETVNAIETYVTSIDGHDITEYESKGILKIEAVVFDQFQFPQTPLKFSARPIFERKLQ